MERIVRELIDLGLNRAREFYDRGDQSVGIYPVSGISLDGLQYEESAAILTPNGGKWTLWFYDCDGEEGRLDVPFPPQSSCFAPWVVKMVRDYNLIPAPKNPNMTYTSHNYNTDFEANR